MRGHVWSGTLAATLLAATVVVVAQSPSPSPNAPTPAPQPPATAQPSTSAPSPGNEGRRITVAGCLQASPPSPTGTSGSVSSAPAAGGATAKPDAAGDAKFVLANAVPSSADATPSASSSSTPRTYRLLANEAALNPHVGKKLEITGTVDEQDSSAPAGSDSSASSAASAPRLRVEAGKVLAEPCTK